MNPRLLVLLLSILCVFCGLLICFDYAFIQQMEAYSNYPNIAATAESIGQLPGGETVLHGAGVDRNKDFIKMMVHISKLRGYSIWLAWPLIAAGLGSLLTLAKKPK
jgi:hypothetical protein